MQASILTIGTELLIGQVIDTNSSWLGKELNKLGIEIIEKRSVADDDTRIRDSIDSLRKHSKMIFITGGLGPTKDDITKKTLANYLGRGMYFDEGTYAKIKGFFETRNIPFNEDHRNQCNMPDEVVLLNNNLGTAPGMWLQEKDLILVSMPGVPSEMKFIFNNDLKHKLLEENIAANIFHRTIHTAGIGESVIASMIADIESNLPKGISLAYLPGISQVRVRISGISNNAVDIKPEVLRIAEEIEPIISKYVFGFDGATLPASIMEIMMEKGKTLTLAESCTGGYLSHWIVSTPGASRFFEGAITAYSYRMKEKMAGVNPQTLITYGAVSEEVVREMVLGSIETTGSDYSIAISGIAGPDGGTPDKPVGTVWIACGNKDKLVTKKLQLTKNREMNIKNSAAIALIIFRRLLVGEI